MLFIIPNINKLVIYRSYKIELYYNKKHKTITASKKDIRKQ